ncbi:c-type cytochrome [Sphingomonas sp.]|uniref:c-type cytochrome n=1 Tax=Sphingomonas sp. TaxID=28214 RepID=UPI0025D0239A|nr:c-type cytochrome [Sphingomonas sp.]
MAMRMLCRIAALSFALTPGLALAQAGDAAAGEKLYQARCGSCHSLDANRIGPAHRGVFGRAAASAPGYAYSPALKASGIIWTQQTLDQWLQGPQKMAKGAKMFFTVANPAERAAIIAYLKAQSGK